MTEADVIAAIRADHLRANIGHHEDHQGIEDCTIHWDRPDGVFVDPGGSIFGPGPYLKVYLTCRWFDPSGEETMCRVYAPAWLRRKLARARV